MPESMRAGAPRRWIAVLTLTASALLAGPSGGTAAGADDEAVGVLFREGFDDGRPIGRLPPRGTRIDQGRPIVDAG